MINTDLIDMSNCFVLGKLNVQYEKDSKFSSNRCYYKLYDISTKRFYMVPEMGITIRNVPVNYVTGEFKYNTYNIRTTLNEDDLEIIIQENRKIPKESEDVIQSISTRDTRLRTKYALIGKNTDYCLGLNFYAKTKLFLIEELEKMTTEEWIKNFVIDGLSDNYNYSSNKRWREKYINSLTDKPFDKKVKIDKDIQNILKLNTVSLVAGCNFMIGKDGKIYIKDNSLMTDINIKNFPHKHLLLHNDEKVEHLRIRSLIIDNGPTYIDNKGLAYLDMYDTVTVRLPRTLKYIKHYGLYGSHVRELDLSRCVELKEIGRSSLSETYIKNLVIPDTVEKIGDNFITYNSELETIIFPKNYPVFKPNWILNCTNLKTIVLPEKKMEDWDNKYTYGLGSLTNLKEIWTSEANVNIAQEIAGKVYKQSKEQYDAHVKFKMENPNFTLTLKKPTKIKVILVKRKK